FSQSRPAMKKIYINGFRGLGTRDADYSLENALIFTGHVGIAFEGDSNIIYGFHPTDAEIERIGSIKQAIAKLKAHKVGDTLAGILYDDHAHFVRATVLAEQRNDSNDRNTTVFQYFIEKEDAEFERIRRLVLEWYKKKSSLMVFRLSHSHPTEITVVLL
ncbi:MAG: hypothetical protein ABI835_08890, partial [Chloroflexota bacterium]